MEHLGAVGYNPHLHMVLKNFQSAAMNSLRGPSHVGWVFDPTKMSRNDMEEYKKTAEIYADAAKRDIQAHRTDMKPPFMDTFLTTNYATPMPFLFPLDSTKSDKTDTFLEGETIACFTVGGERRLCLPQILNTLLKPFNVEEVYEACSELNIYFSRCNGGQLQTLKLSGILPESAPSCGLITKTDAARLCHRLLYRCPEKSNSIITPNSFYVYHGCFGKCKGLLVPELYVHPNAKCIQCCDCDGLFSQSNFVCHSHKSLENRTCHWGFDSANWRSYLLLAKHQSHMKGLERSLEEIKSRFDPVNPYKRKESGDKSEGEKKAKYESQGEQDILQQLSVLPPWKYDKQAFGSELPANLHRGPPVILNPERVVPYSSTQQKSSKCLSDFAPNVSLAPVSQQSQDDDCCDADVATDSDATVTSHTIDVTSPDEDDSLEIDVSSSSVYEGVSNNSDSGLSTPTDTSVALKLNSSQGALNYGHHERDRKLKMLRQALDGKVGSTDKAKDQFIDDFMKLCIQDEQRSRQLHIANNHLEQELSLLKIYKKQKVHDLIESKKQLKKEVERLSIERSVLEEQLNDASNRSKQDEASSPSNPNIVQLETIHKRNLDTMRVQLDQHKQVHQEMTREILRLRDQIKQLGTDVPNIKCEIATDDPILLQALISPDVTSSDTKLEFVQQCKSEDIKEETVSVTSQEDALRCESDAPVPSCSGTVVAQMNDVTVSNVVKSDINDVKCETFT